VSELLARLNPKTVSYIGVKGYSEEAITPADVAAALAMVPCPIQREMLCLVYAPNMAGVQGGAVVLAQKAVTEWTAKHIAISNKLTGAIAAHAQGRASLREQLRKELKALEANHWPQPDQDAKNYIPIARAAMREFAKPKTCRLCQGSGVGKAANCTTCNGTGKAGGGICVDCAGNGWVERPVCPECLGQGTKAYSKRQRASNSGFNHHNTFSRGWEELYKWCCDEAKRAFFSGSKAFKAGFRHG